MLALIMGSGKSVVALATVEELHNRGEVTSGFVFCPNSVKFQWLEEIRRRTRAPAQVIDGTKDQRRYQYKHARRFRYNILNYDTLRNDMSMMNHWNPEPGFIVADEASYIKSLRAKRSKAIKALGRRCPYRFALTGQPIENRPEELFSIMEFVDREVLGQFQKFDRTFILRDGYGRPVRYRNMATLREAMDPVMFRRTRKEIEAFLPKINTAEIPVSLPTHVMDLYNFIVEDTLVAIDKAIAAGGMGGWNLLAAYGRAEKEEGGKARGEIMARLTCMRLLCDSPALLIMSAESFDDPDSKTGSQYASWLKSEGYLDSLVDSTKMDTAVELIEEILDEDPANRVVLFAYFKPMLRMLRTELAKRNIMAVMLTGDMNAQQRQVSFRQFRLDNRVLLSSDAGQYGVDLPHANHLISYDLPWSAGAYSQRVARIDRTSSQFGHITVASLVTKGTIEQRQLDMLKQKKVIAEAWIDAQHIDAKGGLTLTLDTLKRFLEQS